jgi:hypothetical protein
LIVSRVLENFTRQQSRVQRAFNQTLTLFHALQRARLQTQQAQLDNATRIYKHMIQQKDPDLETWQLQDDGFDFPLEAVDANLEQWDLEKMANQDFLPPKFLITMRDRVTGVIYGSNDLSKITPKEERARLTADYNERVRNNDPHPNKYDHDGNVVR